MDRKVIVEVVGAASVVASLVFVGLQVRQSAEATRAATVLQLKENWVQLNLTLMENPEVGDALVLVAEEGLNNVDPRSHMLVTVWWRALMNNWSNAYFQYRIRTLNDEQWDAMFRDMEAESKYNIMRDVWDNENRGFEEPFRILMDSLLEANFDPNAVYPILERTSR